MKSFFKLVSMSALLTLCAAIVNAQDNTMSAVTILPQPVLSAVKVEVTNGTNTRIQNLVFTGSTNQTHSLLLTNTNGVVVNKLLVGDTIDADTINVGISTTGAISTLDSSGAKVKNLAAPIVKVNGTLTTDSTTSQLEEFNINAVNMQNPPKATTSLTWDNVNFVFGTGSSTTTSSLLKPLVAQGN